MPEFIVVKPIAVTTGKGDAAKTQHFPRPGVTVVLDQQTAEPFLATGRLKKPGEDTPAEDRQVPESEDPPVEVDADKPSRPQRRG